MAQQVSKVYSKNSDRPVFTRKSIDEANDLLRWFLREILYNQTWIKHPINKIIVAYDIIDQLESKGFVWQAERVRNHLNRWQKMISSKRAHALDLSRTKKREREVSS